MDVKHPQLVILKKAGLTDKFILFLFLFPHEKFNNKMITYKTFLTQARNGEYSLKGSRCKAAFLPITFVPLHIQYVKRVTIYNIYFYHPVVTSHTESEFSFLLVYNEYYKTFVTSFNSMGKFKGFNNIAQSSCIVHLRSRLGRISNAWLKIMI